MRGFARSLDPCVDTLPARPHPAHMIPQEKLDAVLARFASVEAEMTTATEPDVIVALGKEHAELREVAAAARELTDARRELVEAREMASDPEMAEVAAEEAAALERRIPALEDALQVMLLPKDKADSAPVILEVRAGTGGDEAALFAGDLFGMYQRYASARGWRVEVLSASESDVGGYKEIQANVSGEGVYGRLKFESGVHRVQRVPETETQGRIHTSAATVAVLPEAEEVDVEIRDQDLRIDYYRSSGPGGQSVNTTDSACRITHEPTGLVVSIQDEKSQRKNREKAMRVLRSRLYQAELDRLHAERAEARREQVGSGDRSAKIRTYNYPQGRVTDHRLEGGDKNHALQGVLDGGLEPIIHALRLADRAARLTDAAEG